MPAETTTRRVVTVREIAPLAAATVVLLAVAAVFLSGRQFWLDESFSYGAARLSPSQLWHFATSRDGELNMVAYYALLGRFVTPTTSDALMRAPSVLAAAATVPLVWLLADRLSGERFVRVTAVLVFISQPLVIDYAFEARSYALLMFAVTGLTLLLVLALDGSRSAAIAYFLLLPLIIGLQFVALFVIIAHAVSVVLVAPGSAIERVGRSLRLTGFGLLTGALAATVFRTQATLDDRKRLGLSAIVRSGYNLTGRAGPLSLLMIVAIAAGALALGRRRSERTGAVVVLATIAIPLGLALALSLSRPMITAYYLLDVVPLLCAVAAIGIAALVTDQRWRIATVGVFVALGVTGQAFIFRTPDREEPDRATALLLSQAASTDVLVFESASAYRPFRHYLDQHQVDSPLVAGDIPDADMPTRALALTPADQAGRSLGPEASMWVVVSHSQAGQLAELHHDLEADGLVSSEVFRFSGVTVERWHRS